MKHRETRHLASHLTPDALLRLPVCGVCCLSVVGDAAALVVVMAR